jgi:site-specific recombinase XerD
LYLQTHCPARGLRNSSIESYRATLLRFREYARTQWAERDPDQISAREVLEFLDYLRRERHNGAAAINRQVTVLRNLYRAMVALGHLEPRNNPLAFFPKIKAAPRKLPVTLNEDEVRRLIELPSTDNVLGLRDRALLTLLYGTGIRASECAGLCDKDIDWRDRTIRVAAGRHDRRFRERRVLHPQQYRRGVFPAGTRSFPVAKAERCRATRLRTLHQRPARPMRNVSPHRLRHTFATHLIQAEWAW